VDVENCLFCKIAGGEIPAKIVYQDEDVVAFEDIDPQAPQHILVIPRRHITSLADLSGEDLPLLALLFAVMNRLANKLGLAQRGYRVISNVGPDAGQVVLHVHFHLLGGRAFGWPPG
jgi:histidine triad (HIT) family protein